MSEKNENQVPDDVRVRLDGLKKDIAERKQEITRKKTPLISGLQLGPGRPAAGLALGVLVSPSLAFCMDRSGKPSGGVLVLGESVSKWMLTEDQAKLDMDEKLFDAELSGPEAQNWGKYYASAADGPPMPPPPFAGQRRQAARGGASRSSKTLRG